MTKTQTLRCAVRDFYGVLSKAFLRVLRPLSQVAAHQRRALKWKRRCGDDRGLSAYQARLSQTIVSFVPWTEYDTKIVFGSPAEAVIPAEQWSDAVFETPLMNRLGGPFNLTEKSYIFGRITDSCLVTMDEGRGLTVEGRMCLLQGDPLFMHLICDLALRLRCRLYVRETGDTILPHPLILEAQLIEVRASIKAPLGLHPGPTFAELRRQASQPN